MAEDPQALPQALALQGNHGQLQVEGQPGIASARLGEQRLLLCIKVARARLPQPGFKQQPGTTELQGTYDLFPRCLCLRYPSLSSACLVGL